MAVQETDKFTEREQVVIAMALTRWTMDNADNTPHSLTYELVPPIEQTETRQNSPQLTPPPESAGVQPSSRS